MIDSKPSAAAPAPKGNKTPSREKNARQKRLEAALKQNLQRRKLRDRAAPESHE